MAEDKQSFLLYADLIHTVEQLPDDLAGKLFKHILSFVNDQNPQSEDFTLKIAFEPIKQQLKRDLRKYEEKREKNRENARKRWDKSTSDGMQSNAVASDGKNRNANHAVNGTDTVSDNVNGTDTVSDNVSTNVDEVSFKKETKVSVKGFDFRSGLISIGVSEEIASQWLDVRKKLKAVNTEIAFNRIASEIKSSGRPPDECISQAIVKSWKGFEAKWLNQTSTNYGNSTQNQPATVSDRVDAAKRSMAEHLANAFENPAGDSSIIPDNDISGDS